MNWNGPNSNFHQFFGESTNRNLFVDPKTYIATLFFYLYYSGIDKDFELSFKMNR